jgi:hypothetical protein
MENASDKHASLESGFVIRTLVMRYWKTIAKRRHGSITLLEARDFRQRREA